MTSKEKVGIVGLIFAVAALLFVVNSRAGILGASVAEFSPSNCYTAAATTSPAYMTVGAATSTVTCALGENGAESAMLNIEVNATSTASVFNFYVEESMGGVDWFPIAKSRVASTTNPFDISVNETFRFTFASSTVGRGIPPVASGIGINGTDNRNHYSVEIPVTMKRVRVISGVTGANGAVWMQIVPRQPIN